MNFLFWMFLAGIVVASLQDLKRREVDNWLNYLLLIGGAGFLIFDSIFNMDFNIVLIGLFCFGIMFVLGNLFYYGRVFAGGDAKLLIAMFALFVGSSLIASLQNIGIFIIFLLFGGAVWGGVYGGGLVFLNFKKFTNQLKIEFRKYKRYYSIFLFIFVLLVVLIFLDNLFLVLVLFYILFILLFIFAKALENSAMLRRVNSRDLREGDWIVEDVRIGKRIVKSNWEGLTKKDLELLRGGHKNVLVKEGIPFVPGFLIALICYGFLAESLLEIVKEFLALI